MAGVRVRTQDGLLIDLPEGVDPRSEAAKTFVEGKRRQLMTEEQRAELQAQAGEDEVRQMIKRDYGPVSSGVVGMGRGFSTVGRGVGLMDKANDAENRDYKSLEAEHPVATFVGEVAGESAPFVPGGMLLGAGAKALGGGKAATLAASGVLGATEAATIARGEGASAGGQAMAGTVGGAIGMGAEILMPKIASIGRNVFRKLTGRLPAGEMIDASGRITPEFKEVLDANGIAPEDIVAQATKELQQEGLDPNQAARKAYLESQGLEPTRAQITRDATDFQLQEEAAKTSNRVRDALEAQDKVLTEKFEDAITKTGGKPASDRNAAIDFITQKADIEKEEYNKMYKEVREALDAENTIDPKLSGMSSMLSPQSMEKAGGEVVAFNNLSKALSNLMPRDETTKGVVSAVKNTLVKKGIIDKNFRVLRRLSGSETEQIRVLNNELYDVTPQGNAALRKIQEALDTDVVGALKGDRFKGARDKFKEFKKGLERDKVSQWDTNKKNLVRDMLENKINPDTFVNDVVFSKKWQADDLNQLKKYMGEEGAEAFNDVRAETLQEIFEKAVGNGPEDAQGFKRIGAAALTRAVEKIGRKKINVLFNAEEQKFLKDMVNVAKIRQPVRGTAMGKGPSSQAVLSLQKRLANVPILSSVLEFLDFDVAGRAAIKPKVDVKKAAPTTVDEIAGSAARAGAVSAEQERRERK